jgi:hypothetical protein
MLEPASAVLLMLTAILTLVQAALGQGRLNMGAFAPAEVIPERPARCNEVKDVIRDAPSPSGLDRIDFSAAGALSLVYFDGVLAYVGICDEPDAKVLCVTYSTNGLGIGDPVIVTGSYRKMAPNFVILDPCLTNRPEP